MEATLPLYLRQMLTSVHEEVRAIEARIADLERELRVRADANPVVTRLRTIPGIGLLTATALVGTVGHIHAFRPARQFASWSGLTPRHSSGQRRHLGRLPHAAFSYAIPFPWENALAGALLSDWALDGRVRAVSARPVNVLTARDPFGLGYSTVSRPDLVPGQSLYLDDDNAPGGRRV